MVRRLDGRHPWLLAFVSIVGLAIAAPLAAQGGALRGTVKDDKGQPIEGAKVTIELTTAGANRRFETKTGKNGDYIQIGLPSGTYKVTAEKEKVGTAVEQARVRTGQPIELNLVISARAVAAAKSSELTKAFDAGVAASQAGQPDEAIAKFNEALLINPQCADCYYNIGFAYGQKKEYDKAEESYKKAIELKPAYPEAYSALANIYNTQRKFDEAAAANTKATELGGAGGGATGGNAEALYNQGVILWNSGKVADAKKQFEAAIQVNPNHAESHYQLGMSLVNEGNLAGAATEFETYVKLAPQGPNAAQAKALVAQLKK